jgi:hypothetical protein
MGLQTKNDIRPLKQAFIVFDIYLKHKISVSNSDIN